MSCSRLLSPVQVIFVVGQADPLMLLLPGSIANGVSLREPAQIAGSPEGAMLNEARRVGKRLAVGVSPRNRASQRTSPDGAKETYTNLLYRLFRPSGALGVERALSGGLRAPKPQHSAAWSLDAPG